MQEHLTEYVKLAADVQVTTTTKEATLKRLDGHVSSAKTALK